MLGEINGHAAGRRVDWCRDRTRIASLGLLDSLLDVADRKQVLVDLLAIAAPQAAPQTLRVAEDDVEHASVVALKPRPPLGVPLLVHGAEEALEHRARPHFRRHRRRRRSPRQAVAVRAAVAVVAVAA